jgi:hypothetical protein
LRQQGLNLVDLNRAYVSQQEQLSALLQVLQDPTQRAEFLSEYDRQINGGSQPQSAPPQPPAQITRPTFPGAAPPQPVAAPGLSEQQAYATLRQVIGAGMPMDQMDWVNAQYDAIPPETWRTLAPYLIQEV